MASCTMQFESLKAQCYEGLRGLILIICNESLSFFSDFNLSPISLTWTEHFQVQDVLIKTVLITRTAQAPLLLVSSPVWGAGDSDYLHSSPTSSVYSMCGVMHISLPPSFSFYIYKVAIIMVGPLWDRTVPSTCEAYKILAVVIISVFMTSLPSQIIHRS